MYSHHNAPVSAYIDAQCKVKLQELLQKNGLPVPVYTHYNQSSGNTSVWGCTVSAAGKHYSSPEFYTRKDQAEWMAAYIAWQDLSNFFTKPALSQATSLASSSKPPSSTETSKHTNQPSSSTTASADNTFAKLILANMPGTAEDLEDYRLLLTNAEYLVTAHEAQSKSTLDIQPYFMAFIRALLVFGRSFYMAKLAVATSTKKETNE